MNVNRKISASMPAHPASQMLHRKMDNK